MVTFVVVLLAVALGIVLAALDGPGASPAGSASDTSPVGAPAP